MVSKVMSKVSKWRPNQYALRSCEGMIMGAWPVKLNGKKVISLMAKEIDSFLGKRQSLSQEYLRFWDPSSSSNWLVVFSQL